MTRGFFQSLSRLAISYQDQSQIVIVRIKPGEGSEQPLHIMPGLKAAHKANQPLVPQVVTLANSLTSSLFRKQPGRYTIRDHMNILLVHAKRYGPVLDPFGNCNDSVSATNDHALHPRGGCGQRKLFVTLLLATQRIIHFEHQRYSMTPCQFDPSPPEERVTFIQHIRFLALNNRRPLRLQPEVVSY